jgi:hypothetical protein
MKAFQFNIANGSVQTFSFITGNWRRQHSALIQISMSSSR